MAKAIEKLAELIEQFGDKETWVHLRGVFCDSESGQFVHFAIDTDEETVEPHYAVLMGRSFEEDDPELYGDSKMSLLRTLKDLGFKFESARDRLTGEKICAVRAHLDCGGEKLIFLVEGLISVILGE